MQNNKQTSSKPDVTIIVPAFNEEATLAKVIEQLLSIPISKQILIVDDFSTDRTPEIAQSYGEKVVYLRHEKNLGKGAAIRTALQHAIGEVCIVQDADLEYFPEEIPQVVRPILQNETNVVYGSRFTKGMPKKMAFPNKIANFLLAWTVRLLFFRRITDEATCYKAFRTDVLRRMNLQCQRFEFCPEVTAKAIRMGENIVEVPINYEPRSKAEGKKVRWTDGVEAFWTLLRHRFSRL